MLKVENKSKEEIAEIGRKIGEAFVLNMPKRPDVKRLTSYYAGSMMTPAMKWFCRQSGKSRLLTGLEVDEKTAAADACEMEHAVSPESYEALKTLAVLINDRDS